ncbi:MAG TPA: apolipoprotein N-acyltransferase [Candidatus Udaeobacter sp.]|jgi:apolipoprotein N-acyltransferase|nr:apolipoprotein N-acyltransferase [Candidatus Udaeobacter sp.]
MEVKPLPRVLRLWPWLAAICSGLLYTGCFAPFNFTWLCWIALTPLIAAIWFSEAGSRHRWLRNLLLGYVAGLTFFWTAFSWLTTVTIPGWFVLAFYMAIYFAIWAWFCGLLQPREKRRESRSTKWDRMLAQARSGAAPSQSRWIKSTNNLLLAFLVAAAWVTQEWFRGWVFSGFGWNGLGVALHGNWPLIQIAEFTGVAGLSFMVAFANVIAVTTVRRLVLEVSTRTVRPHFDLTLTLATIVGVLTFGLRATQVSPPTKPLRVAAVQSNVPQNQKFDPQFTRKIFDQFRRLSEIALRSTPPPDLLIWPESSMPGPVLGDRESYQFVMDLAASAETDILLGTIDEENGDVYNAALLVSDGGEQVQVYRKLHLVPFGEYVPGRHSVPLLARIVGEQVPGDFKAGKNHTVFELTNRDVKVAPLICFEDTVGELTRRFVLPSETNPGANLLADITNDGWFLHSAASHQHLANAIFRCVETRRPMIRAANTGVTCFVNEFGRVTQKLQDDTGSTFTEGVLTGEVKIPTENDLTFYTRHGELFAKLCAVLSAIATLAAFALRRKL